MNNRRCEIFGEGPALVLIPALACDGRMWEPVMERLAAPFRIFIPRPWECESIGEAAKSIGDCLAAEGIAEVFVAGLSMGGYVAFEFLRRFPGLVKAAALLDTTAFPDTPERRLKRDQTIALIDAGKFEQVLSPFADSVIWAGGERAKGARELLISMAREIGPEGYRRSVAAIRDRGDFVDVLTEAEIPLLFLAGAYDSLTPPALAEEMARKSKRGQFAVIPGSGHLSALENPAAVAAALEDFFTRDAV
ncbi:alpha/beta fold hydrolase [bacterium]|nr:MAG: alpha/beta fold hydrolase [bacterium]